MEPWAVTMPEPTALLAQMCLSGIQGLHQPMFSWFASRAAEISQICSFLGWQPGTVGLCSLFCVYGFTLVLLVSLLVMAFFNYCFYLVLPPDTAECHLQTCLVMILYFLPDKPAICAVGVSWFRVCVHTPQQCQYCVRRRSGSTPSPATPQLHGKKAQFRSWKEARGTLQHLPALVSIM